MSTLAEGAGRAGGAGAPWRRVTAHPSLVRAWALARRTAPHGTGPLLLYALYTAVLFVVFVLATFPHELALRRALEPAAASPVAVDVRGVHLGWTLAYTIDDLRLLRRGADPAVPLLSAARVRVAPSLLGLLQGRPFPLALHGELYGGTLDGTADLRPDAFAVDATVAGLDLGRYTGLRLFMEGALRGRIDGTVELAGNPAKATTTAGRVDLRLAELALEGGKIRGITVPDLHFPEVRLGGVIKGGRLDLGDLSARGREVSVQGTGNLLLARPLAASLLNLDLVASPAPDLPDNLRLALNLLPGEAGPGGDRHLRIAGSLAQPRLQ